MRFYKILFVVVISVVMASCVTSPTGRRQLMLVSEQQAISESALAYVQVMEPLEQQGKLNRNPSLNRRVKRITERLVHEAVRLRPDTADWQWSIRIIESPETINAWCMAGGKMALYTGLIDQIQPTNDELAQVIGHEIAHALANHTAEKMSVALAGSLGVLAISIISDKPGSAAAASVAATLAVTLPNSRTAEREADEIGMRLAASAGYDPSAAATLWQKMGSVGGNGPPQFLSTHPSSQKRQQTLRAMEARMIGYYQPGIHHPRYPIDL
jgi:predicted Zn-dependent protease